MSFSIYRFQHTCVFAILLVLALGCHTPFVLAQDGFRLISQFQDRYPRWEHSGEAIWFYSNRMGSWDLYRIGADGTNLDRITSEAGDELVPVPSPDGIWVAYVKKATAEADEEVYILNRATGEQRNLSKHPEKDTDPNWSPDGQKLVFTSNRSGNYEIWEVHVDGSGLRQVTDSPQREGLAIYGPNGKYLAFQRTMARRDAEIMVKDLETGEEVNVSSWSEGWDGWPSFRPTGEVLFTSNRDGSSQLWEVQPDGSGLRQVTKFDGMRVRRAHWAPDGTKLVTNIERPQDPSVFIVVFDQKMLLPEN